MARKQLHPGICIAGPPASRASNVAELLARCGVRVDRPNEAPDTVGRFGEVGAALLDHFDATPHSPPRLARHWELSASLKPFVERANRAIDGTSRSSPWGWFDPAGATLMPFWLSLLPDLGVIVVVDNPLDASRELARSSRIPLSEGGLLWYRSLKALLRDSEGCRRTLVLADELARDPGAGYERLVRFCGARTGPSLTDLPETETTTRSSLDDVMRSALADEVKLLYCSLRGLASERRNGGDLSAARGVTDSLERLSGHRAETAGPAPPGPPVESEDSGQLALRTEGPRRRLRFPTFENPVVSIVIPTYDNADALWACLSSLAVYTDVAYEVIVVDDCASEGTRAVLASAENLRILRNAENLDFVRSCNRGASEARGRYVLLLNDDVVVGRGWLSPLVDALEGDPKRGAVGPKICHLDGRLQEAGCVLWNDGSAAGYGRGDDPNLSEFCYLREVDFCSGACLLVRADLFRDLGGFDERFCPAYYEDADLCLGIQEMGFSVVYQPMSTVHHQEYGSRPADRALELMRENQRQLKEKRRELLEARFPPGEWIAARDRRSGRRVLVIDDRIPAPHLGSGFPRAFRLVEMLAKLGFVVTVVPVDVPYAYQPATEQLQQLGVEVVYGETLDLLHLLESRAGSYDIVIVSRPHNAANHIEKIRDVMPDARLVYDGEALYCERDFQRAVVEGRPMSEEEKRKALEEEVAVMKHADIVVAVSDADARKVMDAGAADDVAVWGHVQDAMASEVEFEARRDLLFVGGFKSGHPPNVDAVTHFCENIFPAVRERLPQTRFLIVGSNPPEVVRELELRSPGVVVAGFVRDLKTYFDSCRVFVVPFRFGAGISLKSIEAMGHGLPMVISASAAQGLDLRHEREALIAQDDEEFASSVVRLYGDRELWQTLQAGSLALVRDRYSREGLEAGLLQIMNGQTESATKSL